MLETLKKWGTDLTLKVKDLFSSSESQVYVKDLRKVMVYKDGRKCQYPKNYDQIVQSAKIIENRDMHGNAILDKDKNPTYKLLYGQKDENGKQPSFRLSLVTEDKDNDRSYFTINYIDNQDKQIPIDWLSKSYFELLGFSRMDLKKHVPIFEAQKTNDPKYPFELTHSSVLMKKVKNGELLYTSNYKKLSTNFSEIRDQNGGLELDKSLISVPIVFAAGLAKICARMLTFIPIKLGENLIARKNRVAKSFGYLFFTPAVVVKNLVNMGATILKVPILLFVANEKKYGDAYLTMLKHQLKECWKEIKSDFNVVTNGERPKPKQKDHKPLSIVGTWDELDARSPGIERDLEKALNKSSESIDKSRESGVGESLKEKPQNKTDKKIAAAVNQKSSTTHIDREIERRQDSSRNVGIP
ncbi:hypothetical protein [Wolbachia pipientis]|uniref:hypothetical protein n=2 Tax=Wolbachia TaxID=953 RepID=UPI0002404240|nr:hypothetical protein [Wolbachia pipientis]UYC23537.1 hypothetical protein L3551_06670 [Wolbachia endosymbiont of Aedes aegypti]QBB84204.1 hypothetical protein DEJ70_05690 [Wolbachia pipientis wAlbB]QDW09001.1 hypothetical protein CO539_005660 [Wolbachia pipientis]QDW10197.1 hypothetical protein CO538_005665 [Wolbachia pipientis]QZA83271.1 hypothetical protein K1Y75_05540 [Wolbachia pipientis]